MSIKIAVCADCGGALPCTISYASEYCQRCGKRSLVKVKEIETPYNAKDFDFPAKEKRKFDREFKKTYGYEPGDERGEQP